MQNHLFRNGGSRRIHKGQRIYTAIDICLRFQMGRGYAWEGDSPSLSSRYTFLLLLIPGFDVKSPQAVLSVLIRQFSFELVNGPETELDRHISLMARPKVAGEQGAALPMRVRQVVE